MKFIAPSNNIAMAYKAWTLSRQFYCEGRMASKPPLHAAASSRETYVSRVQHAKVSVYTCVRDGSYGGHYYK